MHETRIPAHPSATGHDVHHTLRQLGSRAHQLRAATLAADHFNTLQDTQDKDTGSWLMSCALALSADLAEDIDGLARSLREQPVDTALQAKVSGLRVRTHQLHAAAGCPPTWCRPASRFEPDPCHATRTEKSTAKCWPASFLRTQR